MKLNKKSYQPFRIVIAILLAIAVLLPAFPQKALAAGKGPTYSNVGMEHTRLNPGQLCYLKGSVTTGSGYNLNYVEAVVYNAANRRVKTSGEYNIGKTTYKLNNSKVDRGLSFGKLAQGDYSLVFYAQDIKGNSSKSSAVHFHVGSNLKITNLKVGNYKIKQGSANKISGKISSDYQITSVKASIQKFTGAEGNYIDTNEKISYNPKKKSFKIESSKINKELEFGKLAPGKYIVYIEVKDKTGTKYIDYTDPITIVK